MADEDIYSMLCSYQNLELAFKKARKGKTLKPEVIEFEKNLKDNLLSLKNELIFHTYKPRPLKSFVIRDPKTRKISKSDFRDRVVHHALCDIIEPILDKTFIYDSYANRKGKGVLKAVKRFEHFSRKATKNNTLNGFVLKADIRHYFETVNHDILLKIIKKRINDGKVIWLVKKILKNYNIKNENKGMPLGNLTSQFFANVYLNELDKFIKHKLRAKHYIRYVDDFVIFNKNYIQLQDYLKKIDNFLTSFLDIELHIQKSKIFQIQRGVEFLGFKIFPHHKSLKKKNIRKFKRRFEMFCSEYKNSYVDYDIIYDFLEGWFVYASNANTYKLKREIVNQIEEAFPNEISTKETNRYLKNRQSHIKFNPKFAAPYNPTLESIIT